MFVNCDITVYNKYTENREAKYIRNTVRGVLWEDSQAINRIQSGLENVDKSSIFVSFGASFSNPYKDSKVFRENPHKFMTFQIGDIVVKGIVYDEIKTQKDLETKYDFVRVITSVDKNDFGREHMWHFELGCR